MVKKNVTISLTHITSISVLSDEIPQELKQDQVTPIFKKNSGGEVKNYWLVSVVSIYSKILEKILYNQLEACLVKRTQLTDDNLDLHQILS